VQRDRPARGAGSDLYFAPRAFSTFESGRDRLLERRDKARVHIEELLSGPRFGRLLGEIDFESHSRAAWIKTIIQPSAGRARPTSTVYPRMVAGRAHGRMTTMTLFDRLNQGRSQGEPMRDPRAECVRRAYLEMAAFYRPEAPGDGWGRIELTAEEMRDLDRLDREARDYALAFVCQDETARFRISGRRHQPINPAAIWALEAAYLLCAGKEGNVTAARLLRLALKAIERPN